MISVIVPIYNVEKYLTACIRSITEQTYTDLQILLIDDGSTDQSGMICDAFAEKDSRIKVLHVENRGVSAARNTGIEMAEGEWTAFVDGDDIVHPELLARLLETAERTGADVCKCGYVNIHSKESEKTFLANPCARDGRIKIVYPPEYLQQIINGMESPEVWRSLFQTEALKKCRFDIGYISQDYLYQVLITPYIKRSVYIHDILYGYRKRPGSATTTDTLEQSRRSMSAFELRNRHIQSLYPDLIGMSKAGLMAVMLDWYIKTEDWDRESKKEFHRFTKEIRKRNRLTLRELADKRIPARRRMIVLLSMISMPAAGKIKKRLRR